MDLKDFVSASLADIVQGVGAANNAIKAAGWDHVQFFLRNAAPVLMNPAAEAKEGAVEFDVAVTAGSAVGGKIAGQAEGKASLHVVGVEVSGRAEGEASKHSENVSRIRFTVLYGYFPPPVDPRKAEAETRDKINKALNARRR